MFAEDHAKGLSTFTIMAGLGGCIGYLLGGIDWDSLKFGKTFTLLMILCSLMILFSSDLSTCSVSFSPLQVVVVSV